MRSDMQIKKGCLPCHISILIHQHGSIFLSDGNQKLVDRPEAMGRVQ